MSSIVLIPIVCAWHTTLHK